MSQFHAKASELTKVMAKSMATNGREEIVGGTGREVKEGPDVKAFGISSGSKFEEEVVDFDDSVDAEDEGAENFIKFLFEPELSEVILNEYVVSEIGKYLDFQDLKSLRQVSKVWSAGATPTFLRKSFVVLKSGGNKKQLEAFEAETKNLKGISSLKIDLYKSFRFEADSKAFNAIVAKLSPSLRALEVVHCCGHSLRLPPSFQFPALSSLAIEATNWDMDLDMKHQLFGLLFPSAPNLTELAVGYFGSHVLSPLLNDDGSRNWSLAPKLRSLKVLYGFHGEFSDLANFPQTWEKLEIVVYGFDLERLGLFLEVNKDSLLSLSLSLQMEHKLKLPKAFSKLQKLELSFEGVVKNVANFGGNGLNYPKTFPALSSLSVKWKQLTIRSSSRIWKLLFPPQIFKGLRDFTFHLHGGKGVYAGCLRRQRIGEDWAQTMFPAARIQIVEINQV